MLELFAKIILIGGLLGMGFVIFRKIPALRELAEVSTRSPVERKAEILNLSKISSKTTSFLSELRSKFKDLKKEKKEEKEVDLSDDYWEKIRRG